ncbi:sugar ABC transporter permease [Ancylobacter dichloromethanicus]|uniref:Xylose transport system permease protein XylH n=1 Tax=Ancylobacter dichloromethanicus TaxID=518825 RepID=A0A9W6JB67_9HYPH|nr:sugar ABC transporter permease [Ancylobacter dichloromethanicus]MBS7553575.1 sugar ABC transporter permease [Ancylobacter dichloromethanicus]GLK72635.1 sugar ABC transporter permease [Ancylobacter dichloromethanicus]
MTDTTTTRTPVPAAPAQAAPAAAPTSFVGALEIDIRFLGMIGALAVIWVVFDFLADGTFLTPRNLWNLSVQSSSIAVMSTGMVLVIVMRHIDLSVGSILGVTGMVMAVFQVGTLLPAFGFNHPAVIVLTLVAGIAAGTAIGALHGFVIAYLGVPAFIVTLGGLLVWRGAAWAVAEGKTIPLVDDNFKLLGGGANGSVGETWSWVIAIIACLAIAFATVQARRQRQRFHFPLKPVWAELVIVVAGCLAVIGATLMVNAYTLPPVLARRYAEAAGLTVPPEGISISFGYAIPVLVALAVGIVMTFVTNRTRFGRYVFAIGGNPEAADLAGINTRRVTLAVFALMGALAAIGAAISTARLNSATNAQGTLDELYVIAAAVIGGTSLSGGSGTIAGAMLGALVMQSLQSGMVLMRVDTPYQNIVVGIVLVFAVWIDTVYRKRFK